MGYAAEIFGIFYSQWDYEMVNISRILKSLTWHGFDEFGWNDPFYNLNICVFKFALQNGVNELFWPSGWGDIAKQLAN